RRQTISKRDWTSDVCSSDMTYISTTPTKYTRTRGHVGARPARLRTTKPRAYNTTAPTHSTSTIGENSYGSRKRTASIMAGGDGGRPVAVPVNCGQQDRPATRVAVSIALQAW